MSALRTAWLLIGVACVLIGGFYVVQTTAVPHPGRVPEHMEIAYRGGGAMALGVVLILFWFAGRPRHF